MPPQGRGRSAKWSARGVFFRLWNPGGYQPSPPGRLPAPDRLLGNPERLADGLGTQRASVQVTSRPGVEDARLSSGLRFALDKGHEPNHFGRRGERGFRLVRSNGIDAVQNLLQEIPDADAGCCVPRKRHLHQPQHVRFLAHPDEIVQGSSLLLTDSANRLVEASGGQLLLLLVPAIEESIESIFCLRWRRHQFMIAIEPDEIFEPYLLLQGERPTSRICFLVLPQHLLGLAERCGLVRLVHPQRRLDSSEQLVAGSKESALPKTHERHLRETRCPIACLGLPPNESLDPRPRSRGASSKGLNRCVAGMHNPEPVVVQDRVGL